MFYILEKVWKFSKWKIKNKQSALHLPSISALFPFVTLFISRQFIWLLSPFYVSSVKPILFSSFSAFYCIDNFFLLVAHYILFLRWYPQRLMFLFFPPWPHPEACKILVPWPGIRPPAQQWKCWVLTTGPQGIPKTLVFFFFVVVQSLNYVWLLATPWIAPCQASLTFTVSLSFLKLQSMESVMPSNHLILCCPLLLLPSVFPSINGLFQWVSSSHQVAKVLEIQLQHQSFQWIFRVDFL